LPTCAAAATTLVPVKVGIVDRVANPAVLVTSLEVLTEAGLKAKFGLDDGLEITTAAALSLKLKASSAKVRANVSFSRNAASSRSNLVNYYTHRNWAEDEYHITRLADAWFVVIRRDKAVLDNVRAGDTVVAHNHMKQLVQYKF
jgi:hypothetical protein